MTSWIFSLKFIHAITSYNCIIFGDNDWNYHSLNTSSNETWVHLRICSSIRPFCRLSIRSPSGLCPFVHPCRISFVFSFVRSSGSREGWWSKWRKNGSPAEEGERQHWDSESVRKRVACWAILVQDFAYWSHSSSRCGTKWDGFRIGHGHGWSTLPAKPQFSHLSSLFAFSTFEILDSFLWGVSPRLLHFFEKIFMYF